MDTKLIQAYFDKLDPRRRKIAERVLAALEKSTAEIDIPVFINCLAEISDTVSDTDMFRSAMLTHQLNNTLKAQKPHKLGRHFSYRFSEKGRHLDCPIQFEIRNPKKERIATIGFFLQARGEKVSLHLTNIQGVKDYITDLKVLSNQLGQNWRVAAARTVKRMALWKGTSIVGVLPQLFYSLFPISSPSGYKRTVRQYKQTFRKAGITHIDASKVKPYPLDWKKVMQKPKKKPLPPRRPRKIMRRK